MRPCSANPDRWTEARAPDDAIAGLCRHRCTEQVTCIRYALAADRPSRPVTGIVAGVYLPSNRYGHRRAIATLQVMAERMHTKERA